MEDDPYDGWEWMAAAAENPILVAAELYFMSRPAERVPWRDLLPDRDPSPPPPGWGRKRIRSRAESATKAATELDKEDAPAAAMRASPTTPLSWSAGSMSSGDVGKVRPPAAEEAEHMVRAVGSESGGGDGAFPSESIKVEAVRFAGWRVAAPGSKALVATGGRQGRRKMTMAELKEYERSLLEKRVELRKDLEEQRLTHELLMEENARLRKLESKLLSPEMMKPRMAVAISAAEPERCRFLHFDLNESLPEDPDAMLF